MYYLKYRPKKISELDNPKIREMLFSILKSKNIPHAFLFTGQKGTGKTSAARILAKTLNCLEDQGDACDKCRICQQINTDSLSDVVELDAASNRGIEDIKRLIKEAHFAPMLAKYKVFIIDEAHMITQDAFNALLKTLEEPPGRTIFILATTNPEKLPETIKSRCVILNFGSLGKKDIISMLSRISKAEKLEISQQLLDLIAETSRLSFRDAAKILEELVVLGKLEYSQAVAHLQTQNHQLLIDLIFSQDLKKTLEWVENFVDQGGDVANLISYLLKELKNKALQAIEEKDQISLRKATLLIKLLQQAYKELKYTPYEIIPLELAIIEFYNQTNKN